MQVVWNCESSERVNSGLKTLSGANPLFFWGIVAAVVAEGGSLFPQVRGSIGESGPQKAHRTVARGSVSYKNRKRTEGSGAILEDEVGKRCTRL